MMLVFSFPQFDMEEIGEGGAAGGGATTDTGGATGDAGGAEGGGTQNLPAVREDTTPEAQGADDQRQPATDAAGNAVVPYTPNHKFKVLDKEMEMEEWIRPLLTGTENEAKVRELLEKSHGLEHVKASRQQLAIQLQTTQTQHDALTNSVRQLSGMVQRDDMEGFFEALQIPEEAVLKYALRRIQYREATPEQRAAYDQWRQQQAHASQLESEVTQYRTAFQTQSVQARTQELDISMAKPDVAAVAAAFDARTGKVGAFRAEVINRGRFYAMQQKDISTEDAVKEVMALLGGQAPVPATAGAAPTGGTQVVPKAPEKKPVIPHIAGSGTSPARVVPKSIKQLREIGQKMAAQ